MESITEIAGKYVLYNSDLRILICRKGKYCISSDADQPEDSPNSGIIDHFRHSEHKDIPRAHRVKIKQYISGLDIAKPRDVVIPPPESRPMPGLELHHEGAECLVCHELTSDVRQMKKHCREHGWKTGQDLMWKKQPVQTFFKSHGKELKYDINGCTDCSYIRVTPDEDSFIEPLGSMPKPILENLLKTAKEQEEERVHKLNLVQDKQDLSTLSVWLRHTEWHECKNPHSSSRYHSTSHYRGSHSHAHAPPSDQHSDPHPPPESHFLFRNLYLFCIWMQQSRIYIQSSFSSFIDCLGKSMVYPIESICSSDRSLRSNTISGSPHVFISTS